MQCCNRVPDTSIPIKSRSYNVNHVNIIIQKKKPTQNFKTLYSIQYTHDIKTQSPKPVLNTK